MNKVKISKPTYQELEKIIAYLGGTIKEKNDQLTDYEHQLAVLKNELSELQARINGNEVERQADAAMAIATAEKIVRGEL